MTTYAGTPPQPTPPAAPQSSAVPLAAREPPLPSVRVLIAMPPTGGGGGGGPGQAGYGF